MAAASARVVIALLAAACADATAPAAVPVLGPPGAPPAGPTAAPVAARPAGKSGPEALAATRAVFEKTKTGRYPGADAIARLVAAGFDEDDARGALTELYAACLASEKKDEKACSEPQKEAQLYLDVLAEIARDRDDGAAGPPAFTATLSLFMRLDARGVWFAESATRRVLERRSLARPQRCALPSADELAAAERALGEVRASTAQGPRDLTASERADLAYAAVMLGESASEVGTFQEDETTKLADGDPRRATLAELRAKGDSARFAGDGPRFVEAARAYLGALGWPGPIAVNAEGDMRWGGSGTSYLMRELALYAEATGELSLAHDLYLRAAPGGGMCGTSTAYHAAEQRAGAVRTAKGCREVASFLLWDAGYHGEVHGAQRAAALGIDVARVYRGALFTAPSVEGDGPKSLAERVRALEGFIDTAQGDSIPRALDVVATGPSALRVRAIDALGQMAETMGTDPCAESGTFWGRGSSGDERTIQSANQSCETKVSAERMSALNGALRGLLRDKDGEVRKAAAIALGRTADAKSRAALAALARSDAYRDGSSRCDNWGTPAERCTPSFPVREAAGEAVKAIDAAATNAKSQREALNEAQKSAAPAR